MKTRRVTVALAALALTSLVAPAMADNRNDPILARSTVQTFRNDKTLAAGRGVAGVASSTRRSTPINSSGKSPVLTQRRNTVSQDHGKTCVISVTRRTTAAESGVRGTDGDTGRFSSR